MTLCSFNSSGNLTKSSAAEENHQQKISYHMVTAYKSVREECFYFLFISTERNIFASSCLKKHTDSIGHSAVNSKFENTRHLPS